MKLVEINSLSLSQKINILKLWNAEYPAQLRYSSLDEFSTYLEALTDQKHYLLYNRTSEIIAWAFEFTRDQEKWFAIIINSNFHNKGYGTLILNELKTKNLVLNGWVIDHNRDLKLNGERYNSPLEFYLKNQFSVVSDVRLELEKISAVKIIWSKLSNIDNISK